MDTFPYIAGGGERERLQIRFQIMCRVMNILAKIFMKILIRMLAYWKIPN